MTAKKPPAAKRKPRPKKPASILPMESSPTEWEQAKPWLMLGLKIVLLVGLGAIGGVWVAGGVDLSPQPLVRNDVLQQSYDADRVSQIAILRELAAQPFDGKTDDGRFKAGEWFNGARFRNRATDYTPYTDRVAEAIAGDAEAVLAGELEGGK